MSIIKKNLSQLIEKIRRLEIHYNREPHSVALLAISKHQPIEKIKEAILAGQYAFGENYLQEALLKMEIINDPRIEWHFTGAIQKNKTKKIAEHFSWIHSVDSLEVAKRLNDYRPKNLGPLNICLQLNVSNNPSQHGISFDQLNHLAEFCMTLPGLKLCGLMAIPPQTSTLLEQRVECRLIKNIFNQLSTKYSLKILSMGMSDDMEAAIAEGSSLLRIGTAIFGPRE